MTFPRDAVARRHVIGPGGRHARPGPMTGLGQKRALAGIATYTCFTLESGRSLESLRWVKKRP
jgi:hypothetical protein